MPDGPRKQLDMLLVEPETLLRRTVALTARSLGMARVFEAATTSLAQRMLASQAFHGAVIALDHASGDTSAALDLVDQVRGGATPSDASIPIAVMADRCDAALLMALRERGVVRIILKPFRARLLIETFNEFGTARKNAAPAGLYRQE